MKNAQDSGSNLFSRRRFLATGAMATALTVLPRRASAAGKNSPGEKLNIAGIGVGGMGATNLAALESENIVALCDVDPGYASQTFAKYPKATVYSDYRQMFDKQKDIDAVLIATPDHTHAVISMAAMNAGKHVYCQKPLTHDVFEARRLAQAAKERGVITQMGIQGHSSDSLRSVCEWIWDGAIGEIREVDAWCSLSYYPWGQAYWSSKWGTRPTDTPAVPSQLNWDLWLGPAPERPYHPAYHPGAWRCRWDFGCGMMGDRGAHSMDVAFWALNLGAPSRIEATSCGANEDVHPLSSIVTYRFPQRGALAPVKLTWYEGTRPPRPENMDEDLAWPKEGGVVFKGSKGQILCGVYADSPKLLPLSLHEAYKRPAKTLARVKDSHEMEWVRAIKEGRPANAAFDYSGPLTELCLLGNVAKRVDGLIEWDGPNLKVTNNPEANRFIRAEYRKGWSL